MTHPSPFPATALRIAAEIWNCGPGDLANVRRMDLELGAPILWRLAPHSECDIRTKAWSRFAQLVALMTPLSKPNGSNGLHEAKRSFGHLLADGGDQTLEQGKRPAVSEPRFTSFLLSRGASREVLLERLVRQVKDGATTGIDMVHFAALTHGSEAAKKRVIRDYYDTANIT